MTGAVLIGATLGMFLHFTGSLVSHTLHIQDSPERSRRRVKREPQESIDSTPEEPPFDYLDANMEDTKYLPYSTILEEEENSHDSE